MSTICWVVIALILASGVVVMVLGIINTIRPTNLVDEYCARADQELDDIETERKTRRHDG